MLLTTLQSAPRPHRRRFQAQWQRWCALKTEQVYREHQAQCVELDIDVRDLFRQVLLHAPRVWGPSRGRAHRVDQEAHRVCRRLIADRRAGLSAPYQPPHTSPPLVALDVREIPPEVTDPVLRYYHYLHSPRDTCFAYGVFVAGDPERDRPIAVFTLSRFDLPHIEDLIAPTVGAGKVLVLSRVYAAPCAPPNLVSRCLRLVCDALRQVSPNTRLLLSYINPNLGFDGSSLRAANWRILCRERRDHYLYLDGTYMTDRTARHRFGSADFPILARMLGERVEVSGRRLAPLEVYAYWLRRSDRCRGLSASSGVPLVVPRWEP